MKKKVLFLIPTLMNGGAERVLLNLVNNLDYDTFDVTVKTIMNVGRYQHMLDSHIHYEWIFPNLRRASRLYFNLFSPEYLYNKYVGDKYDIVVSYLEGMTARIISGCKNPSTKKISWIHIELNTKRDFSIGFRSYKEAQRCYNSFDEIACVSASVKKSFENISGICDKTKVIYNTNDTYDILKKKDEVVDDFFPSADVYNICSVAKVVKTKGYDRLARIHKKLLEAGVNNHVYIIGTGNEQKSIEDFLQKNGLISSFTFLGYKENPYKYISKCDLYVCSSLREGFSTAVTEALVVGLPVVSTNCSGAYELLGENNEYGIVTDNNEDALYNGIYKMLTEEGLLEMYKKKSTQRAAFFSTKNTVKSASQLLLA